MKTMLLIAAAGLVLSYGLVASLVAQNRDPSLYVGTKACGICHKKDETGNQFARWQESPHAKAYELLGTPEAKEVGKKYGIADPQKSASCLKCHSTAYHFSENLQTEKITVEEGVTCESCHGPGKKYMPKSVMEDRQKAIEAGMIYPASQTCTMCHNDSNPTWNPEKYTTKEGEKVGFDFEQAFEKIKHPNPQKQ